MLLSAFNRLENAAYEFFFLDTAISFPIPAKPDTGNSDREKALHHADLSPTRAIPIIALSNHYRFRDLGKSFVMQVPRGDIFYQFRRDVNEGKLPAISWLPPPEKFSDHPTAPWYGAWYSLRLWIF